MVMREGEEKACVCYVLWEEAERHACVCGLASCVGMCEKEEDAL